MQNISLTLETFHSLIFLSKEEFSNIFLIFSTLETSQEQTFWLKDECENMLLISVTLETSHDSIPEKSLL